MSPDLARQRRLSSGLVVALAVVSVVLVACTVLLELTETQQLTIFYVDVGICVLFLAEFLWSWQAAGWRRMFLLRNWYDLVGMIPVAHPDFIQGGWTLLLWLLVVLARIGRAADRLVGERVTHALTARATLALVNTVRQPLTVAVLDDVADVLQTGHYTRNLARALEENQVELTQMIREKVEEDRLTGRVSLVPFHESLIDTVTETTLRVVFAMLADPRTDELVSDVLQENIEQMRQEVRANAYGAGQGAASFSRPQEEREPGAIPERDDIPGLRPRRP